jgi:hypothetical protein
MLAPADVDPDDTNPVGRIVVGAGIVPAIPGVRFDDDPVLQNGSGAALDDDFLIGRDAAASAVGQTERRATAATGYKSGSVRLHVDAVIAGAAQNESGIGCVDFDDPAGRRAAQVERGDARGDAKLQQSGILRHQADLRVAGQPKEIVRADQDFSGGAVAGIDGIAGGQQDAGLDRPPVGAPWPPKVNGPLRDKNLLRLDRQTGKETQKGQQPRQQAVRR